MGVRGEDLLIGFVSPSVGMGEGGLEIMPFIVSYLGGGAFFSPPSPHYFFTRSGSGCFSCGQEGHRSFECPSKSGGGGGGRGGRGGY